MALLPAALEQHARGVRLLPALQAQLAHARRRVHVVLRALVRVGVIQGSRSGRGGGSGQGGLVGAAIRVRAERFGLGVRACHDRDEDAPAEVRVHALRRGEPLELLRCGPLRPLLGFD